MNEDFKIEPLTWAEIPKLKGFTPMDWNFDLPAFLKLHFGKDYFFAFVAKSESKIVAVGNGIINGNVGWAGNIIVAENFRRQGIGTGITQIIVEEFKRKNCHSILLIATNSGMPVYYKMGFKTSTKYSFYKCPPSLEWNNDSFIRKIRKTDHKKILALDRFFTGEDRSSLLLNFISPGWGFDNKSIIGFYLPSFGAGFIGAESPEAGLNLLRLKLSNPKQIVVIPEENFAASGFLEQIGSIETAIAPRMYLGEEIDWHPEMIFSRAAGYCG
jgi:GNAT superfamily N-acetyltransferase